MNLDEIVRAGLDDLASEVQPSLPDPAGVRRSVRRTVRLRGGVAIGLAAAVTAAVLLGAGQLRDHLDGSDPADATPRPSSVAAVVPGAVWYADGVLHDGSHTYSIDGDVTSDLAPTSSGVAYGVGDAEIWFQPRSGGAYRLADDAPLGPAADPTSGLVAWFEGQGQDTELVVRSVETGTQVARTDIRDLAVHPPGSMEGKPQPPIQWVGRNDNGGVTVIFVGSSATWRFDSEQSGPGRLTQIMQRSVDASLNVLAQADTTEGHMLFVETPRGGEMVDVLSEVSPLEPDGALSHDGTLYAGYNSRQQFAFVDTAAGTERQATLAEPADGVVVPFNLTWSRDDVVMFFTIDGTSDLSDPDAAVYACPASDGSCRLVADHVRLQSLAIPVS